MIEVLHLNPQLNQYLILVVTWNISVNNRELT